MKILTVLLLTGIMFLSVSSTRKIEQPTRRSMTPEERSIIIQKLVKLNRIRLQTSKKNMFAQSDIIYQKG
jgi:hypothetical protein